MSRLESSVSRGFAVSMGSCKTCPFCCVANENRRKSRAKMLVLLFLRVLSSPRVSGVPVAAVSVQEAAKPILFVGFQACHVVLRGRRGTLRFLLRSDNKKRHALSRCFVANRFCFWSFLVFCQVSRAILITLL